jgi:hypothetical protein
MYTECKKSSVLELLTDMLPRGKKASVAPELMLGLKIALSLRRREES